MDKKLLEIRIHGRGGQGSVTMAELIASAVFFDNKFSQAFPNFGVERRGAPVTAYVRIGEKFIRLRSQIYEPDFIIVLDSSLLEGANLFAGLKKNSIVLLNTEKSLNELNIPKGIKVMALPATKIALEIIGKPIINTILLGAFAKMSGLISIQSVEKVIKERFDGEIAEKNISAARRGFELIEQ